MFIADNEPMEVDATVMSDGDIVNIKKTTSTSKPKSKKGMKIQQAPSKASDEDGFEFDEDELKMQS